MFPILTTLVLLAAQTAGELPDTGLTPGATLKVGLREICRPGYAKKVRKVTEAQKRAVFEEYGLVPDSRKYTVDHLISLELGGSNATANLWPQPVTGTWTAVRKDRLENVLHRRVCTGKMALRAAQELEARNWVEAYKRYVGTGGRK